MSEDDMDSLVSVVECYVISLFHLIENLCDIELAFLRVQSTRTLTLSSELSRQSFYCSASQRLVMFS